MPSTSVKQRRFMRAVAHSPEFAKKVDVPQSVGKDFENADESKDKKMSRNQRMQGSMYKKKGS